MEIQISGKWSVSQDDWSNKLIENLASIINEKFSSLSWILQETLYNRIKKQQKGWISIDYLHNCPLIKNLFRAYNIQSHTQHKKNIIKKALKQSILKRKQSMIKRKQHINIKQQAQKAMYFEINEKISNNIILTTEIIQKLIDKIKQNVINMYNQNKMEIQQEGHNERNQLINKEKFNFEIRGKYANANQEFYQDSKFKKQSEPYKWCFVYFPKLSQQQFTILYQEINKQIKNNWNYCEQNNGQKSLKLSNQESFINIYSLSTMISHYKPIYEQIRQSMGRPSANLSQQYRQKKIKQRKKYKQSLMMLPDRALDKRIDLTNSYHLKLKIEKDRQAFRKYKQQQQQQKKQKKFKINSINTDQKIEQKLNGSTEKHIQQSLKQQIENRLQKMDIEVGSSKRRFVVRPPHANQRQINSQSQSIDLSSEQSSAQIPSQDNHIEIRKRNRRSIYDKDEGKNFRNDRKLEGSQRPDDGHGKKSNIRKIQGKNRDKKRQ